MGDTGRSHGGFPTTSWSNIISGRTAEGPLRRETLEKLFSTYWRPVFATARFGWNLSPEDAEDAVQSFFLDLLERDFLRDLSESRGRFRNFLKGALKNFLLNLRRERARLKRGGDVRLFPLEEARKLESPGGEPDQLFDREWIQTVLGQAHAELRDELERAGKTAYLRVFELYDLAETPTTYRAVSDRLGLSENDVRNYLHYARERFRETVIRLVWDYAVDEEDAREEVGWLLG